MDIKEIKSRKETLIILMQNLINEFEKETGVAVVGIDYMNFTSVGHKSTIKIEDIKLWF